MKRSRARRSPSTGVAPVRYRIQAIDRAVGILDCFSPDETELGVRDIAERTGLHKSTAHRILMALQHNGLIEQDAASGKYHLGIQLFELGQRAVARLKLHVLARPFLTKLMEQTKETAVVATLDGVHVVILDTVEGPYALQPTRIGNTVPSYCTALGKAMLACFDEARVRGVLAEQAFKRYTARTPPNIDALLAELKMIRRQGYAVADEELEVGLAGVGAAIRDYSGQVIGAINVAGSSARLRPGPSLGRRVKQTAELISAALGHGRADRKAARSAH